MTEDQMRGGEPTERPNTRVSTQRPPSWHNLPMEVVAVATRNVVLTEHQEAFIASLVGSGKYQNASEVLREGLRLLERRELAFEARLAAFRDAAQKGWDDIDTGRYTDVDDEDLDAYLANLGTTSAG